MQLDAVNHLGGKNVINKPTEGLLVVANAVLYLLSILIGIRSRLFC